MSEPTTIAARAFSWKRFAWGAAPLMVLGVMVLFELPICPFRVLFGIPCPGCGLTRATGALVTGELGLMLQFHPLAPIVAPLAVFSVGRAILVYSGALSPSFDPLKKVPNVVWTVFAVALLGLWFARALGQLGGLPDPLDVTRGLFYRGAAFLVSPFFG